MIVKIYLDASDETRWLAILLSADPEPYGMPEKV